MVMDILLCLLGILFWLFVFFLVIGGILGALALLVWIFLAPFSKKIGDFCLKFLGGDKGGFWWPGMMR